MFFIVSKLLAFIITPIIWIIGLLFYSIFSKNQLRKRKSLIFTLVLLLFFTNSFLFDEAMRQWEIPATKDSELSITYNAGIVLGGIIAFDQVKEFSR